MNKNKAAETVFQSTSSRLCFVC